MALTTVQQVQAAYMQINRGALSLADAGVVASAIDGGTTTFAAYQASLIAQAATTTTAAVAVSTFIEGTVPSSARIDSLTAFAKIQNDYYTNVLKSANAQLGAYEALGKAFAVDPTTTATFTERYGALSATDFVNSVYSWVFDQSPVPSPAALANLIGQVAYFTDLYTNAGIPAAAASLQAKGAVLGQIVGYAATGPDAVGGVADPSSFDNGTELQMNTAANEARAETVPSTVYGVATLGNAIDLTLGSATVDVSPSGIAGRKSTQFSDTISAKLAGGTNFSAATTLDGGAGVDSLTLVTGAASYAPAADVIKSIEKATFVMSNGATVSVGNIKGLTDLTVSGAFTGAAIVIGIDTATNLHITSTAANSTVIFGYASAPAVAKVAIDVNFLGSIQFSDLAVTSVIANVTVASSGANFSDQSLTAVTVTSKGDINMFLAGSSWKTLDLTGVGTFSKINITDAGFTNALTASLGKGADVFEIDVNKGHTITLGAGADTLELNQVSLGNQADVSTTAKVVAALATVTDFSKSDGDVLRLDGVTTNRTALNTTQLGQIAGASDIKAAATAAGAISGAAAADSWVIFNFGPDAYALYDLGNDGFSNNDTLIKLTGVQVSDLTATNLILA